MSLEQPLQITDDTRITFEKLFDTLPRLPFDPKWVNDQGQFTPAVMNARIATPSASIESRTGRRLILIPTHRFGTIVMFDKWGERGQHGPVDAAHPFGFDMIDFPFPTMASTEDQVAADFETTDEATETEGLTPVFNRLLHEVETGTGNMVRFH